jgi:hypothetical protein
VDAVIWRRAIQFVLVVSAAAIASIDRIMVKLSLGGAMER